MRRDSVSESHVSDSVPFSEEERVEAGVEARKFVWAQEAEGVNACSLHFL